MEVLYAKLAAGSRQPAVKNCLKVFLYCPLPASPMSHEALMPGWTAEATRDHEDALARHCAACAYDLRGLPGNGICPECGTAYDSQTLVVFGWPGRTRNPVAQNPEHAWRGMM